MSIPDFSLIGQVNPFGAFTKMGIIATVMAIFSLVLMDFFDTMGTMVAIGREADLLDKDGSPVNAKQILIVDSVGAMVGGAASISTNTCFAESAAGVDDGARTGLASVVTGALFLLATFFTPLVEMVPYEAASPALVVVGFLMMTGVVGIDWKDLETAIPAFLTIVVMPFTYSISVGIGAGFISFVVIKLLRGKAKQVHPLMWIASLMFLVYFLLDPLKSMLGIA
jgi:AGZA family xanthine/uracil permease-like MFS transporter